MEVNIGEVQSTVRTADGTTLLTPEVLNRIVAAVMERVREEDAHHRRAQDERRLDDFEHHREAGGR